MHFYPGILGGQYPAFLFTGLYTVSQMLDGMNMDIDLYLKQENLYSEILQEEGDIVGYVPLNDEPVNRCFGIDCYQIGDTIVEEKEYAKYKV